MSFLLVVFIKNNTENESSLSSLFVESFAPTLIGICKPKDRNFPISLRRQLVMGVAAQAEEQRDFYFYFFELIRYLTCTLLVGNRAQMKFLAPALRISEQEYL